MWPSVDLHAIVAMCSIVYDLETIHVVYGLLLILYTIIITMCSIVNGVGTICRLLLIL